MLELRQYTLRPGQRDTLIELFDRELVETQEAVGMTVIAQFRDVDDLDRFVWVRGFPDMASRAEALTAFYGGPVWKAHGDAANATMVDSSNVLLLRPVDGGSGFPPPLRTRPQVGAGEPPSSVFVATIYYRDTTIDGEFLRFFADQVQPVMAEAGAPPLAVLQTEPAENNYPALPVREGENSLVWFSRFESSAEYDEHVRRAAASERWNARVLPELLARVTGPPQLLRLRPTTRSQLA